MSAISYGRRSNVRGRYYLQCSNKYQTNLFTAKYERRFLTGRLGRKISAISGDDRETSYLFQRVSVLIQRFNATLLHESFAVENRSDD